MSETKKRPHTEDEDELRPKKRAISSEHGSIGQINGVTSSTDEPKEGDNLEIFRKEAIYRRMKFYSREFERSEARVADLERRRSTCEAGLAALEACWTQIIGTIRLLVKPEDLPPIDVSTEDLFDLTSHISEDTDPKFVDALQSKMQATSELVGAFVRLRGQAAVSSTSGDAYRDLQRAQTECYALRSELSLTRTRLKDAQDTRDKFREALLNAERRIDRIQSQTKSSSHGHSKGDLTITDSSAETPASPAPPSNVINGAHTPDSDGWLEVANARLFEIHKLRGENLQYEKEVAQLREQLIAPSDQAVVESVAYKTLEAKTNELERINAECLDEIVALKAEIERLQIDQQNLAESMNAAHETAIQDLKSMVAKRDHDIIRLRESRDQQIAELNERRQKDHVKMQSLQEMKAIVEARSERLKIMASEITRLKARLAADAGDSDLLSFLLRDSPEEPQSYVQDLKGRLADAEARNGALEVSLSRTEREQPQLLEHVKAEAEAREKLANVEQQLKRYQSVYGDSSPSVPADLQALSARLQSKEDEIQTLRLQVQQRAQAEEAAYEELEKLSTAWETLDRRIQDKVFDLTAIEERLAKSTSDKARSDNKFYAAMKDKEALESERKNMSRKLDKQTKVIDKMLEAEKAQKALLAHREKELETLRQNTNELKQYNDELEVRVAKSETRAKAAHGQTANYNKEMDSLRTELHRRRADLRKEEEAVISLKNEQQQLTAQLKANLQHQNTNPSTREAELQSEVDKCMSILKCSTCRQNMRNTVITKCMHSFCRQCVDARIATRQRKCPACNLPFSQGEVHTLFFQ